MCSASRVREIHGGEARLCTPQLKIKAEVNEGRKAQNEKNTL